jgi:DNA mismatch repair protein MutS2
MLFDNEKMLPLYILSLGKPGSSYAFEIAQKIGLNVSVLESARRKIGNYQKKVDTLLVDLERDKKELIDTRNSVEKREQKVKALLAENEQLKAYLEENKKHIIKNAKIEAQSIIKNANKLIENTISEIKESNADKAKTQQLRQNLDLELKKHEIQEKKVHKIPEKEELKQGDWVKFLDSENIGQVLEIARDNVILAMGDLRSVVKLNRVEKVSNRSVPKEIRKSHGADLTESFSTFKTEIDLRGMRGDEAIYEIEKYLDRAVMLGLSSLKIIHGKGDGILRKLIREYLKKYSSVSRIEDEHPDRGGDGITFVYLK